MITNFQNYVADAGRYDALRGPDGQPRDGWQRLIQSFSALDSRRVQECRRERDRLLTEMGIGGSAGSASKAPQWNLDLLPYVVTSQDWRDIETGLAQRAELLRAIAADIYGEQRLLRSGLLPAECVFGHPDFLLPCIGASVPTEQQLVLYGAEIGRAPDGQLWVTQDWTQTPSGMGYALISRMVISRVFPSLFRDAGVHPVLPFLRSLRSNLMQLADNDADQIVLMTGGEASDTYNEHLLLARQLGIALVEGRDLQVSHGRCWLRGTDTRQPVSVILRHLFDADCDPLELNRRTATGTAGLLQAVRNRRLSFANPLGSGVLENPLLMRALPQLCEAVLGETLKLPSVDTWWCANSSERKHVLAKLDSLLVRRVDRRRGTATHWGPGLSRSSKLALAEQIQAMPEAFVAHTAHAHPSAPVLSDLGVASHPVSLRTFAVGNASGFRVMSGGIARASESPDGWRYSARHGGLFKDVWVLGTEPWHEAQTLPQFLPRQSTAMQLARPRVAENLFWLGRYAARTDSLARLLGLCLQAVDHAGDLAGQQTAEQLLALLRIHTGIPLNADFQNADTEQQAADPGLRALISGPHPSALWPTIDALAKAAQPIQDYFVPRAAELIHTLSAVTGEDDAQEHPQWQVERIALQTTALLGQLLNELPDTNAAAVIEMGSTLEHCLAIVRVLRGTLIGTDTLPAGLVPALLQLFNITASRSSDDDQRLAVLRASVTDTTNPQSLRRRLMRLEQLLDTPATQMPADGLVRDIADQITHLGLAKLDGLAAAPQPGGPLDLWLDSLQQGLRKVSPRIQARFTPRRAKSQAQLVPTS